MPNWTTFGWEQEFGTGAEALIADLHRRGLAGDSNLHPYHCDCDGCTGDFPVYGQRDSSCSGEIISRVYAHGPVQLPDFAPYTVHYDAHDVLPELQDAAIAVDAEPGLSAGLHVHVGTATLDHAQKQNTMWAFLRWEPVLMHLAAGRYEAVRGGMNAHSRQVHNSYLTSLARHEGVTPTMRGTSGTMAALEDELEGDRLTWIKQRVFQFNCEADRHSNLNTATMRGTFEYRLWNSTRSAWRLDLFTRLTVAMVDQAVVAQLNRAPLVHRFGTEHAERFIQILERAGHGGAAALAQRQFDYIARARDNGVPEALTVLA